MSQTEHLLLRVLRKSYTTEKCFLHSATSSKSFSVLLMYCKLTATVARSHCVSRYHSTNWRPIRAVPNESRSFKIVSTVLPANSGALKQWKFANNGVNRLASYKIAKIDLSYPKQRRPFRGRNFCFFCIKSSFCAVLKHAKHVKSIPIDINNIN